MGAKTVVWTGVSPFEGFVGTFEERAAIISKSQKALAVVKKQQSVATTTRVAAAPDHFLG